MSRKKIALGELQSPEEAAATQWPKISKDYHTEESRKNSFILSASPIPQAGTAQW